MQTYSIKVDRRLARENLREGNNSLSILSFSSFLSSTFVFGSNTRNVLGSFHAFCLFFDFWRRLFGGPSLPQSFYFSQLCRSTSGCLLLRPDFSELVGIIGCLSLNDTNRYKRHFVLLDQMNNKDRTTLVSTCVTKWKAFKNEINTHSSVGQRESEDFECKQHKQTWCYRI